MYYPFYFGGLYSYMVFIIPPLLISLYAQIKLKSTFYKYQRVKNKGGYNAATVARMILDANNLRNIRVVHVNGTLTDHFDKSQNIVALSDETYNSQSVAAIGVAAHEVGHALQYKEDYFPIKLRAAIIPATNIGSSISIPLLLLGIFFSVDILVFLGIALFSLVFIFQLITLPVEYNASHRALVTLKEEMNLDKDEISAVKKVLSAAALTYLAAVLMALAQLLRLVFLSRRND